LVPLALAGQREPYVVVGAEVVGVNLKHLLVLFECLVETPFRRQGQPPVADRFETVRIEVNGPVKARDGFLRLPATQIAEPEIRVRHPALRIFGDSVPHERFEVSVSAALPPGEGTQQQQKDAANHPRASTSEPSSNRGSAKDGRKNRQRSNAGQILV